MEYSGNPKINRLVSAVWRYCFGRWAAEPRIGTLAMSSIALIMLLLGATQLERPGRQSIPVSSYNITPADNTPSPQPDSSLAVARDERSIGRVALPPEPDIRLAPPVVARASLAQQTDALIAQANTDITELRLTTPPGNNAWERLIAVAVLDPRNGAVQRGLQRILSRYIQLAKDAESRGQGELSQIYLRRAESVLFGSGKFSLSWQTDDHSALARLNR